MVICNKRYTLDFAAGADMFDQVGSLCRLKIYPYLKCVVSLVLEF